MEKYLRRCLDSLIIDEEGMKQLEVLVINDGSKDSSSQIAHEYQDKYPDTYRVIDKENGNYGSCINRGLKEATGKYVKVLDADDWFDNGNFAKYVVFLNSIDCDMILTSFNRVDSDGNIISSTIWEFNGNDIFPIENMPLVKIEMHAITYRTELLVSMSYYQTEGISYTDTEWCIIPLQNISTCITFPMNIYQYVVGRAGQTIQPEVFVKNYDQLIFVCNKILDSYDFSTLNNKADKYITYVFTTVLDYMYRTTIINDYNVDFEPLITFDNSLKYNHSNIYRTLGNIKLSKRIRVNYIYLWRKHHYSVNKTILSFYILYKKLKQSLIK